MRFITVLDFYFNKFDRFVQLVVLLKLCCVYWINVTYGNILVIYDDATVPVTLMSL